MVLGRNPVMEALRGGRAARVMIARGSRGGAFEVLLREARSRGVRVEEMDRSRLDRMAAEHCGDQGPLRHQGVIAYVAPLPPSDIPSILESARSRGQDPLVVALDGIEDPMNLGSIIRTAEASGAHGVIVPRRRAAGLTPAVARASAGAIEHLPVVVVSNLVYELRALKERGLWIAGLDAGGDPLWETDLKGPLAIVVGGEGKGIGRLVKETCDFLVGIPMMGRMESLNAGVAAALVMYEALHQRMIGRSPAT